MTEAAGRGRPIPVRNASVERQDDPLSRAMRLSEYRQAPPLDASSAAMYDSVIRGTVGKWHRRNRISLDAAGITKDDLLHAGHIWACNFHHRYRREDNVEVSVKFLGRYIQQRCAQLAGYAGFFCVKDRGVQQPIVLYTDDIEAFDHGAEDEPTREEVTAELRDRLTYLRPTDLKKRVLAAVEMDPSLEKAAKRILRQRGLGE